MALQLSTASFAEMPEDIIGWISRFLSPSDLDPLRYICKSWEQALYMESLVQRSMFTRYEGMRPREMSLYELKEPTNAILSYAWMEGVIVSVSSDHRVRIWDARQGKLIDKLKGYNFTLVDGKRVAVAVLQGKIEVWDISEKKIVYELGGLRARIVSLVSSPDGTKIAFSSADQTINVWDIHEDRIICRFNAQSDRDTCRFSSDGNLLISSSHWNDSVEIWDISTRLSIYGKPRTLMGLSPKGKSMMIWDRSGQMIQVFDLSLRGEGYSFRIGRKSVSASSFSSDEKMLGVGFACGTIGVWNTRNGELIGELQGHTDIISSLAFSHNKTIPIIASSSRDRTIRIWNLHEKTLLHTLKGHTYRVVSCAFHPDGKTLASSSRDGTVRIWDLCKGRLIHKLQVDKRGVSSWEFVDNGKRIMTLSRDGIVRVWAYDPSWWLNSVWNEFESNQQPWERFVSKALSRVQKDLRHLSGSLLEDYIKLLMLQESSLSDRVSRDNRLRLLQDLETALRQKIESQATLDLARTLSLESVFKNRLKKTEKSTEA